MSAFACQRCGEIIRRRADEFELRAEIISAGRTERLGVRKLVSLCRSCAEEEAESLRPFQGVPPLPSDPEAVREAKVSAFRKWREHLHEHAEATT